MWVLEKEDAGEGGERSEMKRPHTRLFDVWLTNGSGRYCGI